MLDLMCSMLGFGEEDKAKISESRRRQGWRDISLASDVQLPPGAAGAKGGPSLSDAWQAFLEEQVNAEASPEKQRPAAAPAAAQPVV